MVEDGHFQYTSLHFGMPNHHTRLKYNTTIQKLFKFIEILLRCLDGSDPNVIHYDYLPTIALLAEFIWGRSDIIVLILLETD